MNTGFGAFEDGCKEWVFYTERLEQLFTANDIKAPKKKRATLLSIYAVATQLVIRNLMIPESQRITLLSSWYSLCRLTTTPCTIGDRPVLHFHNNVRSDKDGSWVNN